MLTSSPSPSLLPLTIRKPSSPTYQSSPSILPRRFLRLWPVLILFILIHTFYPFSSAQSKPERLLNSLSSEVVLSRASGQTQVVLKGHKVWQDPPRNVTRDGHTVLGLAADAAFDLGDVKEWKDRMRAFAQDVIGGEMGKLAVEQLEARGDSNKWTAERQAVLGSVLDHKNIWTTAREQGDEKGDWTEKNREWKWEMLDDVQMEVWVERHFGRSGIKEMWDLLPQGILRADTLRYLLLFVHGGVYTDTDTVCLRPISEWGRSPTLYTPSAWLTSPAAPPPPPSSFPWSLFSRSSDDDAEEEDFDTEKLLGSLAKPSIIVGVEADVGDREDWADWWPRPAQLVQWTLASTPYHPILLDVLSRIHRSTHLAHQWQMKHNARILALENAGDEAGADDLRKVKVMDDPKRGGAVSIVNWTGPGAWTDATLSYLAALHSFNWPSLRSITRPLRLGDVVILPVTGFSPGIGNFGAQGTDHAEAMVKHDFEGSWKPEEEKMN